MRKRAETGGAECREDGGIGADAWCERVDRDQTKSGGLAKQAKRLAKIGEKARHASYYSISVARLRAVWLIFEMLRSHVRFAEESRPAQALRRDSATGRRSPLCGASLRVLFDTQFPGGPQRTGENILVRRSQANVSMPHFSKPAWNGKKDFGRLLDEGCLLLGGKRQIPVTLRLRGERSKSCSSYTEGRQSGVFNFFCALQA